MKNARMQILLAVSAQIDNTVSAVCYDFKKSKQTPLKKFNSTLVTRKSSSFLPKVWIRTIELFLGFVRKSGRI